MTKKERKEIYSNLLSKETLSKKDKKFMWDEFRKYYYDLKWLEEYKDLKVGKDLNRGTKCFMIKHKKSGEWSTIGTNKLLAANPKRDTVNQVLRNLIEPQIKDYRVKHNIKPSDGLEIDHKKPFSKLVSKWVVKQGYEKVDDLYEYVSNGNLAFTDDILNDSWVKYHKKHAKLQILTKEQNRKKGNR